MAGRDVPTAAKQKISGLNIHIIIGLAIMFGFGYLPAPEPLTPVGMRLVGIFIATLYLFTFESLAWSSIMAIVAVSYVINAIYPPTGPGIWKAIEMSAGNWIISFILASLLLAYALSESGFTKRVTLWFLTRKIAQRSPWGFTSIFLFTVLCVSLWLDAMASLVFFLSLAYEIFDRLGYRKGDTYPMMLVIGIAFSINIAFGMTPISHTVPLMGMGAFEAITHMPVNVLSYTMVGIPIGLICFAGMLLFFRYVVRPDMSNFNNVDLEKLAGERPGPMDLREKLTVLVVGIVVLVWVLPGAFSILAPTSRITTFLNNLPIVVSAFIGVVALLIIKVDGRPLLDFEEGIKKSVNWGVTALIATVLLIGTVMSEPKTGFTDWIASVLMPYLQSGLSTFAVMFILLASVVILTNFLNNVPITLMFVTLSVPLASAIGVNPLVLGVLIPFAAQMAFAVPPAFATIAMIYANDWVVPKKVLTYGLVMMIWSAIVTGVIGYPLAAAILH